jgi:hypothetical protein
VKRKDDGMKNYKKEWWYPTIINDEYIAQLREDYPDETEDLDDESVLEYFNEFDQKYATTWDHVGDAYEEYEPLVEAFLEYEAKLKELGLITK